MYLIGLVNGTTSFLTNQEAVPSLFFFQQLSTGKELT